MSKTIDVSGNTIKLGLLYSKTHEWIDITESPSAVGVSDYAQRTLHDVVFVELPKVGQQLKKGVTMCTLESIKAVAEVYSPVDGVVVEVNSALESKPELINQDPYGEGWLVKVEVRGGTESLLKPEAYAAEIKKLI
uniref:Probable glycine cleavage system H protein n=1 Tax=Candidatus Methanomethylicus mesodigestus TaxID=1867258 RepID=A0A7C3J4S8_9CREN